MNKILLFLFGCVITFSSCNTRRSGMSEVIEKGLERSVLQSKAMAYSLLDDKNKLPRTIGKDGKLLAWILMTGQVDFILGCYGIYLRLLMMIL